MTEPDTQIAAIKKAAKDIGEELLLGPAILAVTGAVGIGVLMLLFWLFAPNSIRYPVLYSWKYSVPRSHVRVDTKPADCDLSYTPIGDKDCHYDNLVEPLRNEQGKVTDVHVMWQKVQVSPFWKLMGEIGLIVSSFVVGWRARGDSEKLLRRERDENDNGGIERVKIQA